MLSDWSMERVMVFRRVSCMVSSGDVALLHITINIVAISDDREEIN